MSLDRCEPGEADDSNGDTLHAGVEDTQAAAGDSAADASTAAAPRRVRTTTDRCEPRRIMVDREPGEADDSNGDTLHGGVEDTQAAAGDSAAEAGHAQSAQSASTAAAPRRTGPPKQTPKKTAAAAPRRTGLPKQTRKKAAAAAPRRTGPPLPDDITAEQLKARPQPGGTKGQENTKSQYSKVSNKWWPKFIAAAGWNHQEKMVFLNEQGKPRDGTFQQLFIYLYEEGVSKSTFKTMLAWAQHELNRQLAERMLHRLPSYICNLPGVYERKEELYTNARQSHMEHMIDLQARSRPTQTHMHHMHCHARSP